MLTWQQLTRLPGDQLGRQDIALANVACAVGLPDADRIDVSLCLDRLDWYTRSVHKDTERQLPRFRRHRYDYRNSEPYFRALVMITVLQRDCALRYHPWKIDDTVPLDTADVFIHGALLGAGGTCASLPVVYLAVGRRLGYPLKLVSAKTKNASHLFVRWEQPDGNSLNMEATSRGLNSDPDDYYRTGVYELTPEQERKGLFLKSMTPQQELAFFLMERGFRWLDYQNHRRAVEAMAWSCSLVPDNAFYLNRLISTMNDWRRALLKRRPTVFPEMLIQYSERRFPSSLPLDIEQDLLGLEALENMLNDKDQEERWWKPMRWGQPPSIVPRKALIDFTPVSCDIRYQLGAPKANSFVVNALR